MLSALSLRVTQYRAIPSRSLYVSKTPVKAVVMGGGVVGGIYEPEAKPYPWMVTRFGGNLATEHRHI